MIRAILFSFTTILLFSSCGFLVHMVTTHAQNNAGELDTEGKREVASPYNDNNVIFKTNRTFVYEVNEFQRGRHLTFLLEMVIIPGAFNVNESKIKYKYHYNPKDLDSMELIAFGFDGATSYKPEYTSLKEEKNDITFHPPRSKTLVCLEAAPFPSLPPKLKKGVKTKEFLFIPKGSWGKLGGSKITWRYEVDSVTFIKDTIPYSCIVNAVADSKKGGYNTLKIHFNTDSGFTKLSYRFQDSTAIDLSLKKIK